MAATAQQILTLGHSDHPIEVFVDLCKSHAVTTIADVRSAPYSKFALQFSSTSLRDALKVSGIKYAFLGRELGARSTDPACYVNGKVQYDRLAQTELFHAGLNRLMHGSAFERIAILCTEKDPLDCHRTLLVARALVDRGVRVRHILADGSLESYEDSMLRLLEKTGRSQPDFFTTLDERIGIALREQEDRIAYVDQELAHTVDGAVS